MPALQRRRVFRRQGNGEVECRPVPYRALHPDPAAMHFHDLLNDREAQASPRDRLGGSAADTAEAFEDVPELIRRDAGPGVGHATQRKPAIATAGERNPPADGLVLIRVLPP